MLLRLDCHYPEGNAALGGKKAAATSAQPAEGEEVLSMPKRFLIVDDQLMIRSFLRDVFRHFDLECEEASNGAEAIVKWENENFHAILMDIEMPEMDGLTATSIIRQKEKEKGRAYTPIFAVSGNSFMNLETSYKEVGLDGFIAKPVVINKLLECVMPLANKG